MPPKLLFVVTEDWYFYSHRLAIARAARDKGYQIIVCTRINAHREQIQREGFKLVPLPMKRESSNPLNELNTLWKLVRIFRQESPDLIHLVALKPILYGSIAARFAVPATGVVGAIAGMGYLGTSSSLKAKLLRPAVALVLRGLFNSKRTKLLVQNPDDAFLLRSKIVNDPSRVALIKGAGVETELFQPTAEPAGPPVVVLAARMLSNKGVFEFVQAAKLLRRAGVSARFILVGDTDLASPAALPREQLISWQKEGAVEWLGHSTDMPSIFRDAHIVCLPSYREGLPKVLIEAMAAGRPIVATDVPGCREVVRHGENGLLVSPRDSESLAKALELLICNKSLRQQMGRRGRAIATAEFSTQLIGSQTLEVYTELLSESSQYPRALDTVGQPS